MASAEFAVGLAALQRAAAERPTAVMCAEAQWRQCHRQLLADAIQAAGWEVVHLLWGGGREPHRSIAEMQIDAEGRPIYPAKSPIAAAQRSLPGLDERGVR